MLRRRLSDTWQEKERADVRPKSPASDVKDNLNRDLIEKLTVLWCSLLKLDKIAVDDDFFDKGGDSL